MSIGPQPAEGLTPGQLEDFFRRVGLEASEHGEARDRARVLGVTPHAVRSWLHGRRPVPESCARILMAMEMMTAEQRLLFRQRCIERARELEREGKK